MISAHISLKIPLCGVSRPPKEPDFVRDFAAALDAFDDTPVEYPNLSLDFARDWADAVDTFDAAVATLPDFPADVELLAIAAGVDFPDLDTLQRRLARSPEAPTAPLPSRCSTEFREKPMHARERGGGLYTRGLSIGP